MLIYKTRLLVSDSTNITKPLVNIVKPFLTCLSTKWYNVNKVEPALDSCECAYFATMSRALRSSTTEPATTHVAQTNAYIFLWPPP